MAKGIVYVKFLFNSLVNEQTRQTTVMIKYKEKTTAIDRVQIAIENRFSCVAG